MPPEDQPEAFLDRRIDAYQGLLKRWGDAHG
jgi:hypothetical protein